MQEYHLTQKVSGSIGEYDENWTLIVPDNGEPYVEYERKFCNSPQERDRLRSHHPIREFLDIGDVIVIHQLKIVMEEVGINLDDCRPISLG